MIFLILPFNFIPPGRVSKNHMLLFKLLKQVVILADEAETISCRISLDFLKLGFI